MQKKLVLVGHCGADSTYLKLAVRAADPAAAVVAAEDEQALCRELDSGAAMVLFNRVLSYGFSTDSAVEVIRRLRPKYPDLQMMLVSNYPDAQEQAVQAGALPGFGKKELGSHRVVQLLREALSGDGSAASAAAVAEAN